MNTRLFSLYYINLEKVYELRMIQNNVIQENRSVERAIKSESNVSISAGLNSGLRGILSADLVSTANASSLKSLKISDNFTVKQTKSNILAVILDIATEVQNLDDSADGDLVLLNHVRLKLENEQLIRLFKILSRDIIRGQVANGIDINKALGALTRDYAYLLSSSSDNSNFVVKIPLAADNEFENNYSVDDLLIGNDLSIYPSYYEPWGYTPLESIAFKVPTITTDLSGFGLWVNLERKHVSTLKEGVGVIHRTDYNYSEVADKIKDDVVEFSTYSSDDIKNVRGICRYACTYR